MNYCKLGCTHVAVSETSLGSTTEDLVAVALRHGLNHPKVACVIPGFRNEQQVACNLGAVGRQLGEENVAFIDRTLQLNTPCR